MAAHQPAKFLIDATAGARAELSGVGRYVHELVRALTELRASGAAPPFELGVRLAKWSGRHALPTTPLAKSGTDHLRIRRIDDRLDRFLLRDVALCHGLDARITPVRRIARVATLHDVFSLERDDLAEASFRQKKRRQYRQLADEADAVICISAATETGFLAEFPRARGRTHVIHHGIAPRFTRADDAAIAALRQRLRLDRPFLLFVGLLSTRKNLLALLDAYALLAKAGGRELDLVLAGKPSHGFEAIEAALARHPRRERIHLLGFVGDAELTALYSAAELFVFPSLSEGFGLPVLEAFACGTGVVASELPVLREIGGAELVTADSRDAAALASAIERALPACRDDGARARRRAHAAQFTWSATAAKTVAVWQTASERRANR